MVSDKKGVSSSSIWDDIKDRSIEMFALSGQKVSDYVIKLEIAVKDKLYVKLSSSAVLPSLEESCKDYDIETADKYVIMKKKSTDFSID